jgi:hypothetical protein
MLSHSEDMDLLTQKAINSPTLLRSSLQDPHTYDNKEREVSGAY